jgi:hypothetical protein
VNVASATASAGQAPTVGFRCRRPESVASQGGSRASQDSAALADSAAGAGVTSAPVVSFSGTGSVSVPSSPDAGSRAG